MFGCIVQLVSIRSVAPRIFIFVQYFGNFIKEMPFLALKKLQSMNAPGWCELGISSLPVFHTSTFQQNWKCKQTNVSANSGIKHHLIKKNLVHCSVFSNEIRKNGEKEEGKKILCTWWQYQCYCFRLRLINWYSIFEEGAWEPTIEHTLNTRSRE